MIHGQRVMKNDINTAQKHVCRMQDAMQTTAGLGRWLAGNAAESTTSGINFGGIRLICAKYEMGKENSTKNEREAWMRVLP